MCPWLVLGYYVPPFHRLPADRREHQPKSEGAKATERGRAAQRAAKRIQTCYMQFALSSFLSYFKILFF
jgi:hypothetical protein